MAQDSHRSNDNVIVAAQYKPYRDEESVDGLETTSWSDNEPGTIQIYEKTTEELPFNSSSKRSLYIQIASFITIGLLGFLLGYYAPFHRAISNLDSDAHSESQYFVHEDPSIKEKLLLKIDSANILSMLTEYKNTNRIPGSESNHILAQHIYNSFKEFNFDHVTITNHTFRTMLPASPTAVNLLKKDDNLIYSNLKSEPHPYDDTRPFLPLSQANETTIKTDKILYINRGTRDDYSRLVSLGINQNETAGKVFVMRQGYYQAMDNIVSAHENGAIAVLLFPDPDVYGDSSPFHSSLKLPNNAGRSYPTAWGSYGDLAIHNMSSLSKLGFKEEAKVPIPVIPISFDTAATILRGLSGPEAPSDWNCFDFTLYIGSGYRDSGNSDDRAAVQIEFHNQETTISTATVTGIILGSAEPDRYIIIGSRRDSLNRGLMDSVSGSAVMVELARVFGLLTSQGWRPRRTIVFNSFGAETLNMIGSSVWLDANQRSLHARAVAYINCDLVITGNQSAAIAASPLLYQVLYNSTKQVPNPNHEMSDLKTVYDVWMRSHNMSKKSGVNDRKFVDLGIENDLDSFDNIGEAKLPIDAMDEEQDDGFGSPGNILHEYRISATTKTRPRPRKLDLQSMYSPFYLYVGIPVVDVRYAGFPGRIHRNQLVEEMIPLLGSRYDNLDALLRIDPQLKFHSTVAQILAEILRDVSDSVFLPFNILDYAVTLEESYNSFMANYGKKLGDNVDFGQLKSTIQQFTKAAIKFHHRQDLVNLRDALKVRKINDQLMLLERAFLDHNDIHSFVERRHPILSPNDGQERNNGFPSLVEWITMVENESLDATEYKLFVEILKVHYKTLVYTIENAIRTIEEEHLLQ